MDTTPQTQTDLPVDHVREAGRLLRAAIPLVREAWDHMLERMDETGESGMFPDPLDWGTHVLAATQSGPRSLPIIEEYVNHVDKALFALAHALEQEVGA